MTMTDCMLKDYVFPFIDGHDKDLDQPKSDQMDNEMSMASLVTPYLNYMHSGRSEDMDERAFDVGSEIDPERNFYYDSATDGSNCKYFTEKQFNDIVERDGVYIIHLTSRSLN